MTLGKINKKTIKVETIDMLIHQREDSRMEKPVDKSQAENLKPVVIVGGGPIGCMLAIFLGIAGYQVQVYEKREDIRKKPADPSCSYSILIGRPDLDALEEARCDKSLAQPIHKQQHVFNGNSFEKSVTFWAFHRQKLTEHLLNTVDKFTNVETIFKCKLEKIDFQQCMLWFVEHDGSKKVVEASFIFGCDGVNSQVRECLIKEAKQLIPGYHPGIQYKTPSPYLCTTFTIDDNSMLKPNTLHVWEREQCWVEITTPNKGDTFTFFITEEKLEAVLPTVQEFFSANFPSIVSNEKLLSDFKKERFWPVEEVSFPLCQVFNTFLFGDAAQKVAHVPKYEEDIPLSKTWRNCLQFYRCLQSSEEQDRNRRLHDAVEKYCQQN